MSLLFKEINRPLASHHIIVKTGAIVDASVIDTPLKPKGKTTHKVVAQDKLDEQALELTKAYPKSVDKEAAWLKNHILKKAKKDKPLSHWEKRFNKLVGATRFKVERTFGGIKRWFNVGIARYLGLAKFMHTQNLIEAMSYNLYRSLGIMASNCKN